MTLDDFEKKINKALNSSTLKKPVKKSAKRPFKHRPPPIVFVLPESNLTEVEEKLVSLLFLKVDLNNKIDFDKLMNVIKLIIIDKAMKVSGNYQRAAEYLNINRTTLTEMWKHIPELIPLRKTYNRRRNK